MKKVLLALAFAVATLSPVASVDAQTVILSQSLNSATPLSAGEIGTTDQTGSTTSPVATNNVNYYYFDLTAPASDVKSYLGDLNTSGAVSSAIYQVSGGVLSSMALSGTTLTDSTYGGAGVVSTSFNLSPGTEYALAVTGQSNSGGGAVANLQVISAAPEPSTWALMVFGIGAIGVVMRRSRRVAEKSLAAA